MSNESSSRDNAKLRLTVGALLHDIGKVVYRTGKDTERHAVSGANYLKTTAKIEDKEILACVRYHHAADLKSAKLAADSAAYIVYMADNIASATDRRALGGEVKPGRKFSPVLPLSSIFNRLNGNDGDAAYNPHRTNVENEINFPQKDSPPFEPYAYEKILSNITDNLKGIEFSPAYVNSLLSVMEANLAFVPSSTNLEEAADISLYNHVKLTAAFAAAMKDYLDEVEESDYRQRLFAGGEKFYGEKAFLLTTLDLSGIQNFIYTIKSDGALKNLRARSFYLDFMTEHIADCLLADLGLTRANLIYGGGGRVDLLLPNTAKTRDILTRFNDRINAWFIENFDIALYMAVGCAAASSDDLKDSPAGSFAALHRERADSLAERKSRRYSAEQIIAINAKKPEDDTRECAVCKKLAVLNEDDLCDICAALTKISPRIVSDRYEFMAALKDAPKDALPLPEKYFLATGAEEDARYWQRAEHSRIYGKNRFFTGKNVAAKLWVGDYHTGETFEELAKQSTGIKRLGILRADVDNLGATFAFGFRRPDGDSHFVTLSRTAELSRQLSLFFKLHLKKILATPEFTMTGKKKDCRHAAVVYAGGDDLFIVGAWDDIIELAVDIRKNFAAFSENTLTLSAGIGIYRESYPISVMAEETAELEEKSKRRPGKNAVTLPSEGGEYSVTNETGEKVTLDEGTYSWETFEVKVIGEKLRCLDDFFSLTEDASDKNERGKNFLYNLLALLRGRGEKINLARYVYLLARMEPDKEASNEEKAKYRAFAENMYRWNLNDEDTRQLKTAILLYVYLTRERNDDNDEQ